MIPTDWRHIYNRAAMALREDQFAGRVDGRVVLRAAALRVRWDLDDLLTADEHRLRCAFSCSVRALEDPAERRMLEETLLGPKGAATVDDVAKYFAASLRSAAGRVARTRGAPQWLDEDAKEAILDALREAGKAVAFSCGLELLPPFHLELESPSLHQQNLESVQRDMAERRAAGQLEHFRRAAELLKQFAAIRQAAPELSPGAVLQQVSPADRGAMLETLLVASAQESAAVDLWAVSGPYLIRLHGRANPPKTETISLPSALGPLRSVQADALDGRQVLLIGARSGVMLVDPQEPAQPRSYCDPQLNSALGFSRALLWHDAIWACHGEAGLVSWKLAGNGAGAPPHLTLRRAELGASADGPRNLQILSDSHLIFSMGSQLITLDRGGCAKPIADQPRRPVVGIVAEAAHVIVVHEDGHICRRERSAPHAVRADRRVPPVIAAAGLPWLGSVRLLLAGDQGSFTCIGFDDQLLTQYLSPHQGLRMVAATQDLVAGVSADRQRLILWHSWDGRRPFAEIYLTGMTRHRIACVEFG